MTNKKGAQFSTRWDIRTGSPRQLWRLLHDFFDDNGFIHEYEELKLEESPIEGTATFRKSFIGQRAYEKKTAFWGLRIVIGLLLCLTIIFIPFGVAVISSRIKKLRTTVWVNIEGEAYRARGANIDTTREAEVLGVVADTRVTLQASLGEAIRTNAEQEEIRLTKDEEDITELKDEFDEWICSLNGLLPQVSLPSIKSLS